MQVVIICLNNKLFMYLILYLFYFLRPFLAIRHVYNLLEVAIVTNIHYLDLSLGLSLLNI